MTESAQVRLLDFGIAKLLAEGNVAQETRLTRFSGRALTPEYARDRPAPSARNPSEASTSAAGAG